MRIGNSRFCTETRSVYKSRLPHKSVENSSVSPVVRRLSGQIDSPQACPEFFDDELGGGWAPPEIPRHSLVLVLQLVTL